METLQSVQFEKDQNLLDDLNYQSLKAYLDKHCKVDNLDKKMGIKRLSINIQRLSLKKIKQNPFNINCEEMS